MRTIDCRNMSCPLPVVTVKRALEEAPDVVVLLDDGAPRENVGRYARNNGYTVVETQGDGFVTLHITGGAPMEAGGARVAGTAVYVSSDRMGDGPEELGRLLMKNFIITLLDCANLPSRMFFVNSGVLLATEGSEVLEPLQKLEASGVEIASCGVCLDFFGRKELLRAGRVTNMLSIAESLLGAKHVITP